MRWHHELIVLLDIIYPRGFLFLEFLKLSAISKGIHAMKYIMEILPSLLSGAGMTLQIFFLTIVVSIPLGIVLGLGLTSEFKPLTAILKFYVWLMREHLSYYS